MGLNFMVDFLLLLGTNRVSGFPYGIKSGIPAALVGAVYSGACFLPGFHFLGNTLWRLVSLALMGMIAFGRNGSAVRRTVVFILLSMALGGMATGFGRGDFGTLVLSATGVWFLCHMGFGANPGQEYVSISISHGEKHLNLIALRDTGNTLRDPITGESVLILGVDAGTALTGLTAQQISHPVETAASQSGYRLIPYHAVGQPSGMLLMKRYTDVTMDGRRKSVLVAFAPDKIGRLDTYQALTGGMA